LAWRRLGLDLLFRALHLAHRVKRPLTLGVRAIALDAQRRVFLVRHSYTPGWHLPGGGVEVGESAEDALSRELREEGRLAWRAPPVLLGVYFNPRPSRRDHVVVFVIEDAAQSGPRAPNWEIIDSGFFALDALPDTISEATRRRLAEWRGAQPRSALW
jgi:ADP-ribose pyrophosphatase YjhB (NUDIX family)